MKKMYVMFLEYSEVQVFLNEKMEVIGEVCENDGHWRDEYFNPIMEEIGVKVVSRVIKLSDKLLDDLESGEITVHDLDFSKKKVKLKK